MENNLIQVVNDEILTTSLIVAEKFDRRHKNVIQKIESLISELETGLKISPLEFFERSEEPDAHGQLRPMYYMNRDGFTLLAMGFTGSKALEWKLKYIAAFNEMEKRLREPAPQLPSFDDRLKVARLVARTPYRNLPAMFDMFPEYFSGDINSLEYRSDVNTSYQKWIEEYGIDKEWLVEFPTTDIYLNYVRYCTENRIPSMGKKIFYSTLESDFNLTRRQKCDGNRYFLTA